MLSEANVIIIILNKKPEMGCDGRFDIVAKRKKCSQGDVFIFLGLLCVKKTESQRQRKKKKKSIMLISFLFVGLIRSFSKEIKTTK